MALTFDKINDLIGINGTVGVDLLGSARVRDNLFVSGYLTVGGKKFTGLNINGVKAIDKNVKWKGTEIEISKGGTGKDLSGSTGAIQVSSGTLTAGTLDIDKGGTGDIVETSWKNTYITTKADGTLNYDGTDAVTPDLTSIDGTLTIAKGGTSVTSSNTWLNSRVQINTDGTLNYAAGGSGTPTLTTLGGTLTVAKGGTGATDSNAWLNSRVTTNANGTLNYDATSAVAPSLASIPGTVAKAQGGFGADASSVSVALIANNLEAGGLKSGRTLGDGIESQIIFHDSGVAGTSSGDAVAASTIWQEGEDADTYVIKVVFNYQHQTESVVMRFVANLRISGTSTATAKLEVFAMNSGGTAAAASTGSVLASATATHNAATYAMSKSGDADISGLTDGNIYRCEISLKNDRASGDFSYMTGLVVTTSGA